MSQVCGCELSTYSSCLITTLLELKADATHTNLSGDTVLHDAVRCQHPTVVRALLQHPTVVRALLAGSPSLLTQSNAATGYSALHVAADQGSIEVAQELLQVAADHKIAHDVKMQDHDVSLLHMVLSQQDAVRRYTPLDMACDKGHVQLAKLLLDKKADLFRERKDGMTPMLAALLSGPGGRDTVLALMCYTGQLHSAPLFAPPSPSSLEDVGTHEEEHVVFELLRRQGWLTGPELARLCCVSKRWWTRGCEATSCNDKAGLGKLKFSQGVSKSELRSLFALSARGLLTSELRLESCGQPELLYVALLSSLTSLDLFQCEKVTDTGVTAVATHLGSLTSLYLVGANR